MKQTAIIKIDSGKLRPSLMNKEFIAVTTKLIEFIRLGQNRTDGIDYAIEHYKLLEERRTILQRIYNEYFGIDVMTPDHTYDDRIMVYGEPSELVLIKLKHHVE